MNKFMVYHIRQTEKLKNIKITILETIYKYNNGTVEWVIDYLYLWNGV